MKVDQCSRTVCVRSGILILLRMKTTFALLTLFIAILVGGYLFAGQQVASAPAGAGNVSDNGPGVVTTSIGTPGAKAPSPSTSASYTPAQVAAHSTKQSCWTSINGSVYDLTAWISQHPGGEARILSICGKDGTQAFEAQHGRPSDTEPKKRLATFKIGTLAP